MLNTFCEKKKGAFAEKRWNYIADVFGGDEREIKLMSFFKRGKVFDKKKSYFVGKKAIKSYENAVLGSILNLLRLKSSISEIFYICSSNIRLPVKHQFVLFM